MQNRILTSVSSEQNSKEPKKLISMQQAMSIHSNQNCLVKMYSIEKQW